MTGLKDYWLGKMKIELHMPNDLLDATQEEIDQANASATKSRRTDLLTAALMITCVSPLLILLALKNSISHPILISLACLAVIISSLLYGAGKKYLHFKILVYELRRLRSVS